MSDLPPPTFESTPDANTPAPVDIESLGGDFLKGIPEQDRPVVEKYIKDWDSGVTKRFQSIHEQYRPYKDLGADPTQLRDAMAIVNLLDSNPQQVYDYLRSVLEPEQEPEIEVPAEYESIPKEFLDRFKQMEQAITMMASKELDRDKAAKAAAEDAQLEKYLKDLRQANGDFDEDYVLSKMYRGMSGEEAVKAYQGFVNKTREAAMPKRPSPPVLAGGGSIPAGVDPAKMSRGDVKNLVAQMFSNANGG